MGIKTKPQLKGPSIAQTAAFTSGRYELMVAGFTERNGCLSKAEVIPKDTVFNQSL